MSQFAVPFLIVNYGSEMLFILEQRLAAQNVRPEKSAKVLQDICCAVFAQAYIDELVRPQLLYSQAATREVFDKLAHSSSMRLSENSMDKLYDLMTMACKYQLYACRVPRDVARATAMHLEAVRKCVKTSDKTAAAIDASATALTELTASLTEGQMADIRHTLLNFFIGKRVKISLLMQEKLQNKDGSFVRARCPIPAADQVCPVLPVGTIQYFDATGVNVARVETVAHPDAGLEQLDVPDNRLGRNLYTIERKKPNGEAASPLKPPPQPAAPPVSSAPRAAPAGRHAHAPTNRSATAMSALTNLIAGSASKDQGGVTIQNLFDDGAAAGAPGQSAAAGQDMINIAPMSREEMERNNAGLMDVMHSFSAPPAASAVPAGGGGDADDLLDLLDNA
eukprot:CAMPEP_0174828140 /NCGR_PEP_ID=MMETSP1114-20130205/1161_1 /TAXON_ID=312471 /ORGANISM="Neobodo designis, Strain CCAP 1951/1" /LENGTH=393 /DNA_ID=CAMNT_0016061851 /DNA_START=270 /DNA_END=1451 /DNA_ORIENTATION=-